MPSFNPTKRGIALSPSALNLFNNCPLCFWLDKTHRIRRPRGIFPSLPSGMDRVIKDYFDIFRKDSSLPPELRVSEFKDISLYGDQIKLDRWRSWRTGLEYKEDDGSVLSGALDDLMVKDGVKYVPLDYKTKGSPTTPEDAVRYYQNQMDCYALMLESNGLASAGYAYLLYYSPKSVGERGQVTFHIQAVKVETSTQRARDTFQRASTLIRQKNAPESKGCEYCDWVRKVKKLPFL